MRTLLCVVTVLAALALVAGSSARRGPLTGAIDVTCSLGQCQGVFGWKCTQPVVLTSVTINVDVPFGSNGKALTALYLGPGCTGTIGTVDIEETSGTGIEVAGANDLTVGGGSIGCSGLFGNKHQDGIQAMGGSNVTFTGLDIACTTANDAQFRVAEAGSAVTPPDAIVCDDCSFHPGPSAFHDVTIGVSTNSGVIDSTICPSRLPQLTFDTTQATDPVNEGNTFPDSC
jgi:hypothetical protein